MICGVCKSEAIDLVHAHPPYGLRCLEAQLAQAKSEIERLRKIELAAVELRRCRETEIDSMLSHDAAPAHLVSARWKAFDALMNQLDQEKAKGAE